MSKLSYEDKINIYNNKKEGMSIKALSKKYDVRDNVIKYLVRVIDKHGYEVLRTNKNNYYSPNQKEQIINRVLIDGESIFSVAVDEGLSSDGLLRNWISKYKENGYNIVERKRGRSTMPKVTKKKENKNIPNEVEDLKLKNKKLEQENNNLINYIKSIIEAIKDFFRQLLLIGNEQTKEATVDEIKEYYDNKEFSEKDIKYIAKYTSKEDELFEYADIDKYYSKDEDFDLGI